MRGASCLLIAALLSSPAVAGDDFCADRPGLGTSACRMPPGVIQVETSLTDWSTAKDGGERIRSLGIGGTQVRAGLSDRLELWAAFDPWLRDRGGGVRTRGHSDLTMGARIGIAEGVNLVPAISVPTGSDAYTAGKAEASLTVPIDRSLGSFDLSFAPEADWLADAEGRGHHAGLAGSVSLGHDLADRLSAGLDVAMARDFDPSGTGRSSAAGLSLAFMATDKLQLDAELDHRLGGDAPQWQAIVGFAVRL